MADKDLIQEAVSDKRKLTELAVEAAKAEIVEAMLPDLKLLIKSKIKKNATNEGYNRAKRGDESNYPGESHKDGKGFNFEEGKEPMDHDEKDVKESDAQSALAGMFGLSEVEEVDEVEKVHPGDEEHLGHAGMDEELDISEEQLRAVYEAAMQTEATVSKGFHDMSEPPKEKIDAKKLVGGDVKDQKPIPWEQQMPTHQQDYTVKEIRVPADLMQKGLAQNRALKEQVKQLTERNSKLLKLVEQAQKELSEMNLFNSKVLHINQALNRYKLTNEQKKVVVESIDKARSVEQVKMVYETMINSFQAASSLNESAQRKPVANAARAVTNGGVNQKLLAESQEQQSQESGYGRWAELAGIVK